MAVATMVLSTAAMNVDITAAARMKPLPSGGAGKSRRVSGGDDMTDYRCISGRSTTRTPSPRTRVPILRHRERRAYPPTGAIAFAGGHRMTITLKVRHPALGAEIHGVDMRQPMEAETLQAVCGCPVEHIVAGVFPQ